MRSCHSTLHYSRRSGHGLPIQKTTRKPGPTEHSTFASFLHSSVGRWDIRLLLRAHGPTLGRSARESANPQARVMLTADMRNTCRVRTCGSVHFHVRQTLGLGLHYSNLHSHPVTRRNCSAFSQLAAAFCRTIYASAVAERQSGECRKVEKRRYLRRWAVQNMSLQQHGKNRGPRR